MYKDKLFLLIYLIIALTACKKGPIDYNDPDFNVETITPSGNEQYLTLDSDYIFDQNKLHTFELNIPGSSLFEIDSDPTAEQYTEGTLTFEGETLSPVGIRYKGSIGAFAGSVSGPDWTNPSGFKTATKLSMKVKINWNGSGNKFYGLKKLQFHSQNHDKSQMRERLGYWLFQQMGVPAPRSVHARLMINGRFYGVYALTEQIDGRFTKYHFADGDGNLYKECWPISMNGQAKPDWEYLNSLKTNEDNNPSATMIHSFANDIATATTFNLSTVISNWMDEDKVMAYVVTDRAIRHDDGPFHWYCNSGNCNSHNFYWYEETGAGKIHLIPWDLDNAFENITEQNAVTNIKDEWGQTSNNCQPFSHGLFGIQQRSAACDKLTGGWVNLTTKYAQLKSQLINGPLSIAEADAKINLWASQIRAATEEARSLYDDAVSISEWESAINTMKAQLAVARTQ